MTKLAALAAALALGGCVSATDCMTAIPDDLRADVLRYVMDKELVDLYRMPRAAQEIAWQRGTPYTELTPERRRQLAPHAVNYASCIRERVDRQ